MSNYRETICLDYTKESAATWSLGLDQFQIENVGTIVTRVPWGAHETIRGVRDFRSSSRLRLEKFLSLAHERHLKINLVLGLFPDLEAFPTWTLSSNHKSLVARRFWNSKSFGSELIEVPSLKDPETRSGFFEFIEDVFSVAGLYRYPEGPLVRITVDFGSDRLDQDALDHPLFVDQLASRYQTIERLNVQYGTSFKSFVNASTAKAHRLLADKRSWLAAYDYKWCRHQMNADFEKKVRCRAQAGGLEDLLSFSNFEYVPVSDPNGPQFYFDPVMIEPFAEADYFSATLSAVAGTPMLPQVQSFRLFEALAEQIQAVHDRSGLGFLPLHITAPTANVPPFLIVICGKYLASASFEFLNQCLRQGAKVFFPLHLPQYDENLNHHSWSNAKEVGAECLENTKYLKSKIHSGSIWRPETFFEFGEDLPSRILRAAFSFTHE